MTTTIDAMKQAVEALSYYQVGMNDFDCHKAVENDKFAIIALNKAIAREKAQTVEPVMYGIQFGDGCFANYAYRQKSTAEQLSVSSHQPNTVVPLYRRPTPPSAGKVVPQGFQLVPIEPTQEMLKSPPNAWEADAQITWAAMLATAPQPPQENKL